MEYAVAVDSRGEAGQKLMGAAGKDTSMGCLTVFKIAEGGGVAFKWFLVSQDTRRPYCGCVSGCLGERRYFGLVAGVSGIPHAFVVDGKGVIRHHGHPMEPRFEQVVKQASLLVV